MSHTNDELKELYKLALDEASSTLGYLKPEARETLSLLLPRFILSYSIAAFRKAEPQLSKEEKKLLEIGSRSNISCAMFAELTEKGRKMPTYAHEATLRRAAFTIARALSLESAEASAILLVGRRICPETAGCMQAEEWIEIANLEPLPPKTCSDFEHGTCRSVFVFQRASRGH
jgi:hypothetical protein